MCRYWKKIWTPSLPLLGERYRIIHLHIYLNFHNLISPPFQNLPTFSQPPSCFRYLPSHIGIFPSFLPPPLFFGIPPFLAGGNFENFCVCVCLDWRIGVFCGQISHNFYYWQYCMILLFRWNLGIKKPTLRVGSFTVNLWSTLYFSTS